MPMISSCISLSSVWMSVLILPISPTNLLNWEAWFFCIYEIISQISLLPSLPLLSPFLICYMEVSSCYSCFFGFIPWFSTSSRSFSFVVKISSMLGSQWSISITMIGTGKLSSIDLTVFMSMSSPILCFSLLITS